MDTTQLDLPALPANHEWFIDTFQNNEIQAFKPGSKLIMTVKRRYSFLGLPVRVRPSSYPTYIVSAGDGVAYLRETAEIILQDHARYLAHHPQG